MSSTVASTKLRAGGGSVVVAAHGDRAVFSQLCSTYPLKLLSPYVSADRIAVVYIMTYGGGLVGGDQVSLAVDAGSATRLVLLSQGSTKVFKTRLQQRLASVGPKILSANVPHTKQAFHFSIADNGALFLLPDPVTCFRSASYNQIQKFELASATASLVLLDWVTSGRKTLGEDWVFSRYYSENEIRIEGRCVIKDVMLLDDKEIIASPLKHRTLADRLAPYSCYATLILCGPLVQTVVNRLREEYDKISVMKTIRPQALLWSMSDVAKGVSIVRVAALETETVKRWLKDALIDLEDVISREVYARVFV